MIDDLVSLYAFHRWADERVIETCRKLSPAQYAFVEPFEVGWPSIRSVVVHLAWATELWSLRFLGEPSIPMLTDVDLPTVDEAAARLFSAHDRITGEVLPSLTPDRLASLWTYRNIKGIAYSVPFWTVLRHVVNHGTYHRGQLASKFKRRGIDPPATDLVLWAIENTPQPPTP